MSNDQFVKNQYKILATGERVDFNFLKKIIGLEQTRMKKLSEISLLTKFFFEDKLDYYPKLLRWKKTDNQKIIENLSLAEEELKKIKKGNFSKENLEKILMKLTKETGIGELLWPLRATLSGQKASPGPFEIAEILGKEKTLKRIKEAKNKFKSQNVKGKNRKS